MTRTWKLLVLPVFALGLAAVALAGSFGPSTAALPAAAPTPGASAGEPGAGVAGWTETGLIRGKSTGTAHPTK